MNKYTTRSIYPNFDDPVDREMFEKWQRSPAGQRERRRYEEMQESAALMPPTEIEVELSKIPLYANKRIQRRFGGICNVVSFLASAADSDEALGGRPKGAPSLFGPNASNPREYLERIASGDKATINHYLGVKEAAGF